ncbi:MAG TPA: transposase [Candidatus Syntrophosphaera sp.]|nr:transposase [Candidatus Syntrophosphaera sp.]
MDELIARHRRHLPHLQLTHRIYSLTWRLAFTLPSDIIALLDSFRSSDPGSEGSIQAEYNDQMKRYDEYLAQCHSDLSICDADIGPKICSALEYYDGQDYQLHAYCLMPNHVHMLLKPLADAFGKHSLISNIVQKIKSYTAKQINRQKGTTGKVWNEEYFDRYIRDYDDYYATAAYILDNPVKAGLTKTRDEWPYSYYKPGLIE